MQGKQKWKRYMCLSYYNCLSFFKARTQNSLSVAKLISSFYVKWNAMNPSCLSKNVLLYLIIFLMKWNTITLIETSSIIQLQALEQMWVWASSGRRIYFCVKLPWLAILFLNHITTLIKANVAIFYQPQSNDIYMEVIQLETQRSTNIKIILIILMLNNSYTVLQSLAQI